MHYNECNPTIRFADTVGNTPGTHTEMLKINFSFSCAPTQKTYAKETLTKETYRVDPGFFSSVLRKPDDLLLMLKEMISLAIQRQGAPTAPGRETCAKETYGKESYTKGFYPCQPRNPQAGKLMLKELTLKKQGRQ